MEREMRRIGLWAAQPPPAEAFSSSMPFCFDSMRFPEWLQWVFVPRIRALLEQGGPLPALSEIKPMAEEMFRQVEGDTRRLLELIGEFDRMINTGPESGSLHRDSDQTM
jgi:uncharacterized protein YqcC (DUF446 family)